MTTEDFVAEYNYAAIDDEELAALMVRKLDEGDPLKAAAQAYLAAVKAFTLALYRYDYERG